MLVKKLFFIISFILALIALGSPCSFAQDEWGTTLIPKGENIKIGFAAALSGDYANLGIDEKNAAEMAVSEKKAIAGHGINLMAEDDQCEGAPSVAIAEKFSANPLVVGVIGNMCSGGTIPASDIYSKHRITMISPSSTAIAVTNRGLKNLFRTCWNDAIQGKVAAQFAVNKLKVKNVAIIHDKSTYGQGLADEFKKVFEAGKGSVIAYEGLTRGDKDFTPVLTKIAPKKPELIYFGGMAAEAALIVRQMADVGLKSKFMSDDGAHSEKDFIQAAGKSSEGCYVTFAKGGQGSKYEDWKKRFEAKYGAIITFAPQTYDATMVLLTAIEKAAKAQPDGSLRIGKKALADAVRGIQYDGVTGKITFDENGDIAGAVVVVDEVKNGKFAPVAD
ncbi:MAG: branched-chain amino acid ABC transporter substrate-binding protein [Candidatus Tectomicrobia bacterium]|uniref:Branched-chain amino acid ABC transporter substrate-binding protein n=1 Tax=Tectimicrobiota bacterium TaxID=2528274 RepID=A0A933GLP0_UNCTE|nr:branched-chain amino acid ABC transporter substrate-binding protein [Candidatus Tectomicrobia bacterium]